MAIYFTLFAHRVGLLAGLLFGLASVTRAQAPGWQAVVLAAPTNTTSTASVTATTTDASGNVYIAGYFTGTAALSGTVLSSTGLGQYNAFVAKWSPVTQSVMWVRQTSGTGNTRVTGLATTGNQVYATGYFNGATTFGGAALTSAGNDDIFITKLTDAGSSAAFTWAYRAGGNGSDQANSLAVIGSAVYVTGFFADAATFGSATYTSGGPRDGFLFRLTDAGSSATFTWTLPVGGADWDYVSNVVAQGNSVYVAGSFKGAVAFGNLSLPDSGQYGLFLAKLTDAGSSATYNWVQQAQASSRGKMVPAALAVQGSQVYVGGCFSGTAAFGAISLPNTTTGIANTWATDAFVAKLTDTGTAATYVWAQGAGGSDSDVVNTLAVRGTSVYIAGGIGNTASFGSTILIVPSYSSDAYVAKLTDAGSTASFAWAVRAGGSDADGVLSLALGSTAVYVGGYMSSVATFGSQAVGTAGVGGTGFLTSLPDATGLATTGAAAITTRVALFPIPTPSCTLATVQLPAGPAASEATLTLLDAVGRVVRTRTMPVAAGSQRVIFDVAGLAPGVYALHVATGERLGTARLVVE